MNFMIQMEYVKTDLEELPTNMNISDFMNYILNIDSSEDFIIESEVKEFI